MADLELRILNVFTDGDVPFTGNPLAVFPDAADLTDAQMAGLARQLNLSETTFVSSPMTCRDHIAHADVRIFTPTIEMPFAGHPTLGTAAVVGEEEGCGRVVLREKVGEIVVTGDEGRWELAARAAGPATMPIGSPADVAAALGVRVADLASTPVVLDSGVEGLMVALRSVEAIRGARPSADALARIAPMAGETSVYVFGNEAMDPTSDEDVVARMFYVAGDQVLEDPATGSQCANLGAWLAYRGFRGRTWTVRQGEATGRPSVLRLRVDDDGAVFVGGDVREVSRGTFRRDALG